MLARWHLGADVRAFRRAVRRVSDGRLAHGYGDGFGWFNNSGSFDVTINVASDGTPMPLPPSLALVGLGLELLATRRSAVHRNTLATPAGIERRQVGIPAQ